MDEKERGRKDLRGEGGLPRQDVGADALGVTSGVFCVRISERGLSARRQSEGPAVPGGSGAFFVSRVRFSTFSWQEGQNCVQKRPRGGGLSITTREGSLLQVSR
jgi:hypothetical protein